MHTEHKVHECSRLELTRHCFPVIAAAAARSDPRRVTDGAPGTEPVRPVPVRTDRARARTAPPAARYPGGVQPNLKPSLAAVAFHASGSPLTPTTTYIAKATAWFRSRCTAPRRARTRPSHRRQPRPTLKLKRSRSAPVPPPRPSRWLPRTQAQSRVQYENVVSFPSTKMKWAQKCSQEFLGISIRCTYQCILNCSSAKPCDLIICSHSWM